MADSVPKLARNTEKKKKHRGPMESLIPDPKYPPGDVKVTSHCPCAKGVLPLLSLRLVPTTLGYSQCFWPRGHSFLQFGHAVFPRNGWFWRERARRLHGLAETPGDRALGNDVRCGSPDGGCVWRGSWPFMDGIIKKKKHFWKKISSPGASYAEALKAAALPWCLHGAGPAAGGVAHAGLPSLPSSAACPRRGRLLGGWREGHLGKRRTFGEVKDVLGRKDLLERKDLLGRTRENSDETSPPAWLGGGLQATSDLGREGHSREPHQSFRAFPSFSTVQTRKMPINLFFFFFCGL